MKTIVVISDTHYNRKPYENLRTVLEESDYIFHLGDMLSDANELMRQYPEKTYIVAGNNDFCAGAATELVLDVEGRRIMACHGHRYGVKSGTERLLAAAKVRGCDVVLYGHTHEASVEEQDGVLLINPGCMTRFSGKQSYCYLVIVGKKAVATIVEVR